MLIDITDTVQLTHTAAEVDEDIDGSVRGDVAQLKDDTWKAQARENIGAIGGSGGGNTEIVDDEFISKVSTHSYLAKIKKLTGKSVVQNNAIVDTDIKGFGSTGLNIVDIKSVELKHFYLSSGVIYNAYNNSYERSFIIPCEPNTTYTVNSNVNAIGDINTFLGLGSSPTNDVYAGKRLTQFTQGTYESSTVTTGNEDHYLFVYCWNRNQTTDELVRSVLRDICIHIGTSTDSEPYNPYYRNFPIVLRSAGNVADEVEDTGNSYKDTFKVGTVNLGDLTWTRWIPSATSFIATIPNIKLQTTNLFSAIYSVSTGLATGMPDMSMGFNPSLNYLFVRNSSYDDPTAFKTAMSGVMLNYELATPIVEYHDYNLTYPVTENGTEYFDSPISVPCEIEYGIDALNDIVKGVVGGDTERDSGSFDLLWENASPNSAFAAQTINVDLKPYRLVYILCYGTNVYDNQFGTLAAVTPNNHIDIMRAIKRNSHRVMGVTTDYKMSADVAYIVSSYGSETEDNTAIIPYRIYGIK